MAEWIAWDPTALVREMDGSAVFVDVSGFTSMSERLARLGKVGAEEVTDVINDTFAALLTEAYAYSGGLLKFGGDALLLFFHGDDHALRATAAAHGMRTELRRVGRFRTSAGNVTLRMSVGVHTGLFQLFLVGDSHRELIVAGPAASRTVEMEESASAGQILLSPELAAVLPATCLGSQHGPGVLLRRAPRDAVRAEPIISRAKGDLTPYVPVALREAVLDQGEAEHRSVTIAFVHFGELDDLIAREGSQAAAQALDQLVRDVQRAVDPRGVAFLASDVARNGGKIILTAGAPVVTGSDDEQMLLALRDVAATERTLPLHIGVNRGPVYSGEIGPSFRKTYTVMGDAVNLAARLMAKAEHGEILATTRVLEGSRTVFSTCELEPFHVKGKRQPVQAFTVGEPTGSRASIAESRLPLIGRDRELRELQAAWERALKGEGTAVGLVAEPGMGKSRLLEEFLGRIGDVLLFRGECRLYQSATPYFPFRTVLRGALGLDGLDPTATADALTTLVADRAPHLSPWLSLIGTPLELELSESEEVRSLEDRFRRDRLEQAVVELLDAVVREPTVVLVEDTHWVDDASSDLLTRLVGSLRTRPWLLILSRRPGDAGAIATDDDVAAVRIDLEPLAIDAAASLIEAATEDAPLTRVQVRTLAERAHGNPLFLIELLDALRRGEDVETLPASVEGLIGARIDTLPLGDRRRLRELSVLGAGFRVEHTPAVLDGADSRSASRTLRRLSEFVAVDRTGWAQFRHALIRDAAYEGLSFRTRQRLHARVGDSIASSSADPADQAELLSLHYTHARRWPEAWEYSRIAGDRAREIYANLEAARFYERALAAAPNVSGLDASGSAAIATRLCEVYEQSGRFDKALDALSRVRRQVANDPSGIAEVHFRRARLRGRMGAMNAAYRETTRGYRLVENRDGEAAANLRARLTLYGANLRLAEGRPRDALALAERGVHEAEEAVDEAQLALAYTIRDDAYFDLGLRDLAVSTEHALEIYERLGNLPRVARTENILGVRAYAEGRWDDAVAAYRRAQDAFLRVGDEAHAATAAANIGEVLVSQRRLDEAQPILLEAIRIQRAHGLGYAALFAELQLGRLLLERGDLRAAEEDLSHVHAEAVAIGIRVLAIESTVYLAAAFTRGGDPDRALALLDEQERAAGDLGGMFAAALSLSRAEALLRKGLTDEAGAVVAKGLSAARAHELPFEEARLLEQSAEIAGLTGVGDDGASQESAELLRRLGVDVQTG